MAEPQTPAPNQPDVEKILSTIRQIESGGNYGAKAKGSSASGAYQFINDTWQRSTKGAGVGTEYKTASDAPPEVQDAVAAWAVKDILGKVGGDVTKVPLVWYTGNPQGRMTEEALRVNQGLRPDQYQQKWLSVFNRGQQAQPPAVAQAPQAPTTAPRTTAQPVKVAQAATPSLTDMPASYRMALAANYLADTESPETSVVERAMEMINEQQGGARKNPLAGFTQAMSEESVNPFQFVQQPQEEERRRAVPRMPVRMKDGGDAKKEEFDQQKEQERQSRLVEQGLSYAMGPMDIRAVRKPEGYEARVSGSFNQVVPYMDFDPLTGTFKPTEVGVSYGQMGPEGGYRFQYGQPLPREGQRPTPPQVTGQYRRQLDRNSEIQASGYYVPIPGAKDQYGAQFRYLQRFADGGEAVSDEAIRGYLQANPTLTDRQIAAKMDEFNVSKEQMARATGIGLPEVTARYEATRVDPSTISEDVRRAVQSERLTRDQYATLSNYFGNPLTTAELTSADAPTIRDFVNKPRTGFEFASFLATRGPRHGGNNPYGMTLYENLLQPYLNTTQTQFQQDESGASILDPITGQYRPVSQVDQNRYRVQYNPIFSGPSGSGETRTDVGLDYVVDPATGRATLASPYLREFTPQRDRGLNTLLGIAGTVAGYYFFPGMDMSSMFNRALITAGTEGAKRMFNDGGEVVYRQYGSPEEGEMAAQQMTVGTLLPPPEPPPPVPVVRPGVTIPTIREVPQVDAQGRVIREAPAPARAFTPGQQAVGAGEAVLSAVSGLTAPASIVYDLARGVPTKDVSPGRFMYEPRTEAGQEMLQDVGRLAQQYKLDVALPQVQLQRPYPVKAAAQQGIAAIQRGAEAAELPGVSKTAPVGSLFPKRQIDYSVLRPDENAPFVGELERIVADLPGPVRLQEFVNRVNKTARGYEKDRLNVFVENIKNTSSQPLDQIKLTPQQILDGLKETSPKRFLSEVIEPTDRNQMNLWSSQDNPFPNNKVGTVNLSLAITPEVAALSQKLDSLNDAANNLSSVRSLRFVTGGDQMTPSGWDESITNIKSALNNVSELDPASANRINETVNIVEGVIDLLPKFSKERDKVIYPITSPEYTAYRESGNFNFKDAPKVISSIRNDALENMRKLFEEAERKEFIDTSAKGLVDFPTFYKAVKSLDEKAKTLNPFEYSRDLENAVETLREISNKYVMEVSGTRTVGINDIVVEIDQFLNKARTENIYKFIYPGQHKSISGTNPISFSRFIDLSPEQTTTYNIPLKDNDRGAMLLLELQSDRFDARRPTIVKKDPKTGKVISERPNPYYDEGVEEAYPGMGKSGQVIQQLMIKNAIYGAIKRDKGLLLFPGSDSAQAQLYEKLGPNLKQVLKDLGPGFEMKQFTFPNERGENATRWGVYIDKDAAKRVPTQGIRFAKGGMVDKPLYDRAV